MRTACGNEGSGKNVSGDQEPGEGVSTVEAVSVTEELGESVSFPHPPEGSRILCDNRKRQRKQENSGADEEQ